MAKLDVFCVYDMAAEAYLQPFFLPTKGLALRAFEEAVKKPGTPLSRWPSQFALYRIATFDDLSASFEALPPVQLALGSQFASLPVE